MTEIRYVTEADREFWYTLDRHLPEKEFDRKVRDRQGYVLLVGGIPAGILRYNLFWDNTPFCTMLYVRDSLQRKGYGALLMARWEKDMGSLGYGMVLTSTQVDETAQRFYRKMGYKDCGGLLMDIPGYEQPMEMFFCKELRPGPTVEFRKFSEFPRGTMYELLKDAYSFDERNRRIWDANWRESDAFFYDHPEIADKYSLVTCLNGEPIGFVSWDPRNRPDYVEIGHNGIREKYKGRGYGRLQLEEALRRIREYEGLKRIIVHTNSQLIAPKNYEAAGFVLYDRKPNETESAYTGDNLYYEIVL